VNPSGCCDGRRNGRFRQFSVFLPRKPPARRITDRQAARTGRHLLPSLVDPKAAAASVGWPAHRV